MQRYNSFYMIHKGLRQMLYQTAGRLLQTDFSHSEETALLLPQISEVLDLFDGHANTEDQFVLPAIEKHQAQAATLFEEEHVEDHALSNRMRALLNMFHHAVSSAEKTEMGSAIRLAFSEFLVFNIKHMAKEELELNSLLWKFYSDEELHAITKEIIAHIPPEKAIRYNTWMMRGLSNDEIINWLSIIKNEAPEFVFNGMLKLAQAELHQNRWLSVQEALEESAVPA